MRLSLLVVMLTIAQQRLGVESVDLRPLDSIATGISACSSFHHLHLNDARPPFLINFYERLFEPSRTTRVSTGGVEALKSGSMLMLFSRASEGRALATAIWHFGWGQVSLGETYLAHARREVAWEPPLPAERLHLHLRSVAPRTTATWYADVLGARIETTVPSSLDARLPRPENRMPEALVWIGDTGLLIYRTEPPLFSTRGQRADHLAIGCTNLDATLSTLYARGVTVTSSARQQGEMRTAMIEGPDRIAIELVEMP